MAQQGEFVDYFVLLWLWSRDPVFSHRELKLDGFKGDFALKAENWSFYYIPVNNFGAP
jgi:hypothetical protein